MEGSDTRPFQIPALEESVVSARVAFRNAAGRGGRVEHSGVVAILRGLYRSETVLRKQPLKAQEAQASMEMYDADDSGTLDEEEFVDMYCRNFLIPGAEVCLPSASGRDKDRVSHDQSSNHALPKLPPPSVAFLNPGDTHTRPSRDRG